MSGMPGLLARAVNSKALEMGLEIAITNLNTLARDGDGRGMPMYSGPVTSEGLRHALFQHLQKHHGDDRAEFFGAVGEEAFWRNTQLLIDALLSCIAHEGGSKLNRRVPLG